jgi:hypothetical protein
MVYWKRYLLLNQLLLVYYLIGFYGNANATLFLYNMSKPHHGNLFQNVDQEWIFYPGVSTDLNTGIVLSNLPANYQTTASISLTHVNSFGATPNSAESIRRAIKLDFVLVFYVMSQRMVFLLSLLLHLSNKYL